METVTISPKYQVVIPKSIRDRLDLKPGQQVHVLSYGDRIEFLPVRPATETRGLLRGLDTGSVRDHVERT